MVNQFVFPCEPFFATPAGLILVVLVAAADGLCMAAVAVENPDAVAVEFGVVPTRKLQLAPLIVPMEREGSKAGARLERVDVVGGTLGLVRVGEDVGEDVVVDVMPEIDVRDVDEGVDRLDMLDDDGNAFDLSDPPR